MGDTVMLGPPGSVRLPPPIPPFPLAPGTADEWPLWTFLELGALPGAVPCARLHARQVLWEWNLTGLGESVELLVSELTANAVAASQSTGQCAPVRLWLLAGTAQVLVMVWDACPRPPVRAEVSEDAESGRGLLLVEAMSKRWDWYFPLDGSSGKVVWALALDERSLDRAPARVKSPGEKPARVHSSSAGRLPQTVEARDLRHRFAAPSGLVFPAPRGHSPGKRGR